MVVLEEKSEEHQSGCGSTCGNPECLDGIPQDSGGSIEIIRVKHCSFLWS